MNIDLFLEIEDLALLECQIKLIKLRRQLYEKKPNALLKKQLEDAEVNLYRFLQDLLKKSGLLNSNGSDEYGNN